MSGIQAGFLPDGQRLHLAHGPIELILRAWGPENEVMQAYGQAVTAFNGILAELCTELPLLRRRLRPGPPPLAKGPVARRMIRACSPFADRFITPMAAVAGAVADHMLAALTTGRMLTRAFVNDGGDIAFHLAPGQRLDCGLVTDPRHPALAGVVALSADRAARGIATSGWPTKGSGGRSFSLGIADAVTVLAVDAAAADAAASMIANAVDLPGHPGIRRQPALTIDPDSDLGSRLVTVGVAPLAPAERDRALAAGSAVAGSLLAAGLIEGAALTLQGDWRLCGGAVAALAA